MIWWGIYRLTAPADMPVPSHAGTESLKKPYHIVTLWFSEVVKDHANRQNNYPFVKSVLNHYKDQQYKNHDRETIEKNLGLVCENWESLAKLFCTFYWSDFDDKLM